MFKWYFLQRSQIVLRFYHGANIFYLKAKVGGKLAQQWKVLKSDWLGDKNAGDLRIWKIDKSKKVPKIPPRPILPAMLLLTQLTAATFKLD